MIRPRLFSITSSWKRSRNVKSSCLYFRYHLLIQFYRFFSGVFPLLDKPFNGVSTSSIIHVLFERTRHSSNGIDQHSCTSASTTGLRIFLSWLLYYALISCFVLSSWCSANRFLNIGETYSINRPAFPLLVRRKKSTMKRSGERYKKKTYQQP